MDVSKDTAPTTDQGHEELKQRILQLEAALQVKEALLQDQARQVQVSANLIATMRTELRKQSARLVVRCSQRSRCKGPECGHTSQNGSKPTMLHQASRSPHLPRRFHSKQQNPQQAPSVQASEDVSATLAAPPRTTNKSTDGTSSVICVAC